MAKTENTTLAQLASEAGIDEPMHHVKAGVGGELSGPIAKWLVVVDT